LDAEKCGIDVLFFGVQKTFALPPGLAIAVVSEKALEKSKTIKNKGYYFNFEVLAEYEEKNNTPATPAIPLIYGLKKQLERIDEETLKKRFERHQNMLDLIKTWSKKTGFEFFAEKDYESPTVSCLIPPKNIKVSDVVENLKTRGFTVPSGYGKLKESCFRIGHMGEHKEEDVKNLLNAITRITNNNL
jgi:aspartate aminotransferase-like enzyme